MATHRTTDTLRGRVTGDPTGSSAAATTGGSDSPAPPFPVRAALRLEDAPALDRMAAPLGTVADAVVADRGRRELLQGRWLGHALHPELTDVAIGLWTSTHLLDLLGGAGSAPAARLLLGLGNLAACPTALTGLVEWQPLPAEQQRVGTVHAALNSLALGCYVASWIARGRRRRTGIVIALAGGVAVTAGGYLGGHLTSVRKVSSRHPSFESEPSDAAGHGAGG